MVSSGLTLKMCAWLRGITCLTRTSLWIRQRSTLRLPSLKRGGGGNSIYAPATGKVVFAGPLSVRGNATVIDHGWGVYTAYMHQSEILVQPGELVELGRLIGRGGSTGRTTGTHLHWEVWVGGVQVDPVEWLEKPF